MDIIPHYLAVLPPLLQYPTRFCLFSSAAVYVVSVVTSNVSQVDRVWTFLPTFYTAYFALLPLWPVKSAIHWTDWIAPYVPADTDIALRTSYDKRALMMLGLVIIWMFRLSYNTWRRGLFSLKDEDYRWAVLRSQVHPALFQLTNLTFISFIQNVILLLLGLPAYFAVVSSKPAPMTTDLCMALFALITLALEFTSDNQQYAYHAWKHFVQARDASEQSSVKHTYSASNHWPGARLDWTDEDARRGFLCRGLFAYARHPNFACEQSFWWIITLIPLMSLSKQDLDSQTLMESLAYISPAVVLSSLFLSSTLYTEGITSKKYPSYKDYQNKVPMFGPFGISGQRSGPLGWVLGKYAEKASEKAPGKEL